MAIDREIAHSVLGILGNIASGIFFLSSVPTVVCIIRRKSSGGISGDLYVFKLFNCMLWSLYGLPFVHPHDFWVVLTNTFGCVFAVVYIIPYVCYASRKERLSVLLKVVVILLCFIIMVVLLFTLGHSRQNRITVVGILCAVVSSCMHLTLLSQTKIALQSRDMKYLHPNSSIAGFLKGAIWTAYGIVNFDIYIVIPNGVGVAVGIMQVMLAIYLRLTKGIDPPSIEDCEAKTSRRNSMDVSRRLSMEFGKRISLEIISRSGDELEQLGAFAPSLQGKRGPLERQSSMSAVVVPINEIEGQDAA